MEQLYYTWSTSGLDSMIGFRVRAASPGLTDIHSEQFRSINPYLRYTLPVGTILSKAEINDKSPICLTFADAGGKRILLQKVFAGDDAYGRTGNFFCHLLSDLDTNFSVLDAINLWRSPFWQTSAQIAERETSLPTISRASMSPTRWDTAALSKMREFLPDAIQAFLSLNPQQKLYILAPDWQVAVLIYGLALTLPHYALRQLTFSTYEYEVLQAQTRIVGSCRPMTPILDGYEERVADLPASCYDASGLALNCYTRKPSRFAPKEFLPEYAHFATEALFDPKQSQKLKALLDTANDLGAQTIDDFLPIFRVFNTPSPQLTAHDIMGVLLDTQATKDAKPAKDARDNKEVLPAVKFQSAVRFLTQENFQDAVIDLVLRYPQWYTETFRPILKALAAQTNGMSTGRNGYQIFSSFIDRIVEKFKQALEARNHTAVPYLLDMLLAIVPPAHNSDPWVQLSSQLLGLIGYMPWEIHSNLLKAWTYWEYHVKPWINPWLAITWDEMAAFFALHLPASWQIIAVEKLLLSTSGSIPAYHLPLNEAYGGLFEQALRKLVQQTDPLSVTTALTFFASLIDSRSSEKLRLLAELCKICDREYFDLLIKRAGLKKAEKVVLFNLCGIELLEKGNVDKRLPGCVVDVATEYIFAKNEARLMSATTHSLCTKLYSCVQLFKPDLQLQIEDLYYASCGVWIVGTQAPRLTIEPEWLRNMSQAIQRLRLYQDDQYQKNLMRVLVAHVQNYENLYCIVQALGALEAPGESPERKLFLKLVKCRGIHYDGNATLFSPYILMALSFAQALLQPKREQFFKETFSQLFGCLDGKDKATFDQLSASVEQQLGYQPVLLQLWRTFGLPYRPKSLLEMTRDGTANMFQQLAGWRLGPAKEQKPEPKKTTARLPELDKSAMAAAQQSVSTHAFQPAQTTGNTMHAAPSQPISTAAPLPEEEAITLVLDLFLTWDIGIYSGYYTSKKTPEKDRQGFLVWSDHLYKLRHQEESEKAVQVRKHWQQSQLVRNWIIQEHQKEIGKLNKDVGKKIQQIKDTKEFMVVRMQVGKERIDGLLHHWVQYWHIQENLPIFSPITNWDVFIEELQKKGY